MRSQHGCVRWERGGGGLAGVQYSFELSAEGTVGLNHHSGWVRGKNVVLDSKIVSRGRSHAEFPSLSRCLKFGPS